MQSESSFARIFRDHRPSGDANVGDDALAGALDRLWSEATAVWPTIRVDPESFVRHLAMLVDAESHALVPALEAVASPDLYLAFACSRGEAEALGVLDERMRSEIEPRLRRMGLDAAGCDEVQQELRVKLLTSDGTRPPRIADYAGRGSLGGWLRVAAVRTALNLRRHRSSPEAWAEACDDIVEPEDNPELAVLRRTHRAQFTACMREAFERLAPRQRNLLRQVHLDGLRIMALARIYGVHRVTASRWLAEAQADLMDGFRQALAERTGVELHRLTDVLGSVEYEIDVSVGTLLRSTAESTAG